MAHTRTIARVVIAIGVGVGCRAAFDGARESLQAIVGIRDRAGATSHNVEAITLPFPYTEERLVPWVAYTSFQNEVFVR